MSASIDLLGSLPLFSACSTKELKHIDHLVVPLTVQPGRVLITQGELGSEAFVIASGEAEVTVDGQVVATASSGVILGEMSLLDRSTVRSATVTATTEMELLVLDPRSFSDLVDEHPTVMRRIAVGLAQRLAATDARLTG